MASCLRWIGGIAMALLSGLVVVNSLAYFSFGTDLAFVVEKGRLGLDPLWRGLLRVHVAAGILCLISSMLLFSRIVLRRWPAFRRVLGRVYVGSVLGLLCPIGAPLAFAAKGGASGTVAFLLTGALTFYATWLAYRAIRHRDIVAHRDWMTRSMALIATAVSFRLLHIACYVASLDADTAYLVSLWLSLGLNLCIAEIVIERRRPCSVQLEMSVDPQ